MNTRVYMFDGLHVSHSVACESGQLGVFLCSHALLPLCDVSHSLRGTCAVYSSIVWALALTGGSVCGGISEQLAPIQPCWGLGCLLQEAQCLTQRVLLNTPSLVTSTWTVP